ncbi:amidohydrolase [Acidobacteria bacterium AH-259-L09]|nr:amidohydrolase [Acidobacteria bacterium AH-259-L09]
MSWNRALSTICFLSLLLTGCQTEASEEPQDTADDLKNIPIQDYHPTSMLKTEVTEILRAKFPAIDVHNHLRQAQTPEQVDEIVRAMDAAHVAVVVNLDGAWGESLAKNIEIMNKRHPGRFIQFMRLDWSRIEEPDFGEAMARQLEEGYRMGARGLKISKRLGLNVRKPSAELLKIDDPSLDPIWAKCGELGIPVAIHIADPAAFFTPLDRENERLIELMDHPDWSFHGPQYPTREELHAQRNTVIGRHSRTTFIALHVANNSENLETVAQWLEQYPNLYVETGARLSELGRQPYTARHFFVRYRDRVLFGTDTPPLPGIKLAKDGVEMYRLHWRFFESDDEYFDISRSHHAQGLWKVYGLYLPDEVLEKLYNLNAQRVIPGARLERQ